MKVSNSLWKEKLSGRLPEALEREVDIFESEIALRKQGKIDERVFAETRLRRGTYGQRYDNGQRHDGAKVQQIRLSLGRTDQGPDDHVGRARHAAHQDSRRRNECAAARDDGGTGRGIFRRHRPRDHAAGFSAPLHSHRRHASADAAAGRGGNHHARGLRKLRAQRYGVPLCRRMPRRSLRRDSVFPRAGEIPDGPSRLPELRAEVQARVQRLRAACLRPHQSA